MATSSVAYNKPVLPRVSDTSDLASNRASVYSGKGLSFDGVNDLVDVQDNGSLDVATNFTYMCYVKLSAAQSSRIFLSNYSNSGAVGAGIGISDIANNFVKFYTKGSGASNTLYSSFALNNDQWYFVVGTYDGATKKVYINGVLDSSVAYTDSVTYSSASIRAGALSGTNAQFLNGQLSNIKFFDVALTAAQVAELYNNPEQILPTGVSAVNLKLWLPMMEGAGSYVYNGAAGSLGEELVSNGTVDEVCQKWAFTDNGYVSATGGKLVWNAPNGSGANAVQYLNIVAGRTYRVTLDYSVNRDGFSIVLGNANAQPIQTGTGTYTVDLTPTSTNSGYFSLNMSGGTGDIVGYMDNISVKEVVPQATGTISGATWVAGLPKPLPQTALMDWNKYPFLDGTGDRYYSTSTMKNFNTLSGGVSAYCRVIVGDKINNNQNFFSWGDNSGYRIRINTSDYFEAIQMGASNVLTSSTPCVRGKMHTVVGVVNSSGSKLYVDGQLIASNTTAFTNPTSADNLTIGAYSSTSELFDGSVLDVKFWEGGLDENTASSLSAGLITPESVTVNQIAHFDGANDYTDKLGNYSGIFGTKEYEFLYLTPKGLTTGKDIFGNSIVTPRSAGAFNFDGASWALIDDNQSLDIVSAISMEAWIYFSGNISYPSGYGHIFVKPTQSGWSSPFGRYALRARNVDIAWWFESASYEQVYSFTQTGWHHLVVTKSGTSETLYVDGVSVKTYGGGVSSLSTSTFPLLIGVRSTTSLSEYLNTEASNLRIYNYALTAEQVADNFNQKASTFGKAKVTGELQAYINRTVAAGATVEAHSALLNTLTELENK